MKVLGLGSALIDLLIRIENDAVLDELGFRRGSMQLVDDEELDRLSAFASGFESVKVPGGSACNTMRAMANLKNDVGFIAKAGMDSHADTYYNELTRAGVDSQLIPTAKKPTGVATTFVSRDGERTFGTYLGASILLNADDLTDDMFDGYDCFYLESYKLVNYPLVSRTAELARQKGMKYALDLGSYNIVEEHLDFLKPFVREHVDILFANEEEALAYTGKPPHEALDEMASEVAVCVVKVGERGALIRKGDEYVEVPAFPVTPLDTTGAGDFFSAGFLHGYAHGYPLDVCGRMGSLLASYVIRYMGPNLPDEAWGEVKKQLKTMGLCVS